MLQHCKKLFNAKPCHSIAVYKSTRPLFQEDLLKKKKRERKNPLQSFSFRIIIIDRIFIGQRLNIKITKKKKIVKNAREIIIEKEARDF